MLNISEFLVVRLIFLPNFDVKYAGQAHLVMQLNTKTASRNYSCCLAGSQRKPFKK